MRLKPAHYVPVRFSVIAMIVGVVNGCSNPWADDAPTLSEVFDSGWLNAVGSEAPQATARGPLYCYGTIGREECHAEPLPADGSRLVGFEGPPPPVRDDL